MLARRHFMKPSTCVYFRHEDPLFGLSPFIFLLGFWIRADGRGASARVLPDDGGGVRSTAMIDGFFQLKPREMLLKVVVVNLKAAGYSPEQVDEVVITHMHADHLGGVTKDTKAFFPNGRPGVSNRYFEGGIGAPRYQFPRFRIG